MIFLKTDEEIELMRIANLLVGKTLAEVAKYIKPGVTTRELDNVAKQFIVSNGAKPSFLGYPSGSSNVPDFPGALCLSVNDHVVHGLPNDYILWDGDVISVDCGTEINGFCGDSAYTFCVGTVADKVVDLLKATKASLYEGIAKAIDGNRVGDVSSAVQDYCEARGYSVVRELVGHGIGRKMHEAPEVPNYGKKGTGPLLKKGMCIAIEPMINMGSRNVVFEADGWTVRTKDRKVSAHFEHTVAIKQGEVDILSSFDYIKEVLGDKFI